VLFGGEADDWLDGGSGADSLDGGNGNDTLDARYGVSGNDSLARHRDRQLPADGAPTPAPAASEVHLARG